MKSIALDISKNIAKNISYPTLGGVEEYPFMKDISRQLIFNSESLSILDLKGDETRPLIPDRCVFNDGVGGNVILPSTLVYSKYAKAWRVGGTSYLKYTNGINDYTYTNGVLTSTVTTAGGFNSNSLALQPGNNYDYRLWDLSNKSLSEINSFFLIQAPLFNKDLMKDNVSFPYHRWLLNESNCTMAFDSGTATPLIHGTYIYNDVNTPVETLHNTTIYPSYLKNRSNKEGYSKSMTPGLSVPCSIKYDTQFAKSIGNVGINFSFRIILKLNKFRNGYDGLIGNSIISSSRNIRIYAQPNGGTPQFNFLNGGVNEGGLPLTGLNDSTVKDMVITVNRSGYAKYYLSGQLISTSNISALSANNYSTNLGFLLGSNVNNSLNLLSKYQFYKVELYNEELSQSKIIDITTNGTILESRVLLDELNGSTIGINTGFISSDCIIPNLPNQLTDIFGRNPLYKGAAKLNAEVLGGTVAKFTGSGSPYLRTNVTIYDRPYEVETEVYFDNSTSSNKYLFRLGISNFLGIDTSNKLFYQLYDGSSVIITNSIMILPTGWYKIKLRVIWGTSVSIYVNDVLKDTRTNALLHGVSALVSIGSHYGVNPLKGYMGKTRLTFLDNNETYIWYLNNRYDSATGNLLTNMNGTVTFEKVTNYTPQSTIDWLRYGGYILADGSKIPNPQFALPVGATQVLPKGYNFPDGGVINFDPQVWETYKEYGSNIINNGTFDTDTGWTKGTGWSISSGKASALSSSSTFYQTSTGIVIGKKYRVIFTVSDYVIGTIAIGDNNGILGTSRNANGTYVEEVTNRTSINFLAFYAGSSFTGSIDNVIVQEVIEHIDSPNRGSNLIVNGSGAWTDSNSDGLADSWINNSNVGTPTIGTDSIGKFQKISYLTSGFFGLSQDNSIQSGKKHIIKTKIDSFATSGNIRIMLAENGVSKSYTFTQGYRELVFVQDNPSSNYNFYITGNNMSSDGWIKVYSVEAYPVPSTIEIGDLNHSFFNFLSTVGNSLGLPEIHPLSIIPLVDVTNPYNMTEAIYQFIIDNASSYTNQFKGFVYWLANTNLEHLLVYKTKKTDIEENLKLLKYKPNYYA